MVVDGRADRSREVAFARGSREKPCGGKIHIIPGREVPAEACYLVAEKRRLRVEE